MNRWMIRTKLSLHNITQPHISKSAKINQKAEVLGKVFIGEETSLGHSKIIAEGPNQINIGKDTTIKDCVLVTTKETFSPNEQNQKKVRDVFIGNKVFISSEVSIFGPSIISNGSFIGCQTKIANSKIGSNCVIEGQAIIKNVTIPEDTFIPKKAVIDSNEKLKELISILKGDSYCELDSLQTAPLLRAG